MHRPAAGLKNKTQWRLLVKSLVSPAPKENRLPQSEQHGCQSIIWLINSSCPSPCCLLSPPCCLSLSPTPSLPWLPPLLCGVLLTLHLWLTRSNPDHTWMTVGWADVSSLFFKVWGSVYLRGILGEARENDTQQCSALTSKQLQLYTFWSRLLESCQVPRWNAFGIHSAVRRVQDSSIMAGVK